MLRAFGVVLYSLAAILILGFIFLNRAAVSITLSPLSDPIETPLYVALVAMFMLGLLIGLAHSVLLSITHGRNLRRQQRANAQVERELSRLTTPSQKT